MKKAFILVLALFIVCLTFVGCQKYSDTKPMEEKKVEKFIEDYKKSAHDDFDDWEGYEINYKLVQGSNSGNYCIRYNSEKGIKYVNCDIDNAQMGTGLSGSVSIEAYIDSDAIYFDSYNYGDMINIEKQMFEFNSAEMSDATDELGLGIDLGDDYEILFATLEEFDAEELEELEVEVFVTQNAKKGEIYRFELSKDYLEHIFEKEPDIAEKILELCRIDNVEPKDVDIKQSVELEKYEVTYEFDKDGKLILVTVEAEATVDDEKITIDLSVETYDKTVRVNADEYKDMY